MKTIAIFLLFFILCHDLIAGKDYQIIPFPNKLIERDGYFEFRIELAFTLPKEFEAESNIIKQIFEEDYYTLAKNSRNGNLEFRKNSELSEEGYKLLVTSEKITVEASTRTGCFWAMQTLRQLIKPNGKGSFLIPNCEIWDSPAFPWRGYLLDEARYFKGKESVKVLLDEMAFLKMNVFQWHLTDDAGWRVEIKKYPKLTSVGAWRDSSQIRNKGGVKFDSYPHGGYYTQGDIREIVDYAAKRHITIIPEIEMPGHNSAAISAYPWLGTSGESIRVPVSFGIKYEVLNVADEKVYVFLKKVLNEVMNMFPSHVIHIGGDEVRSDQWKESPAVNSLLLKEKLLNYSDVHVYFINRVAQIINENGRRMMGWNDILGKNLHEWSREDNSTQALAKNSIIHFWKGDSILLKEAVNKGYDVVNALHLSTYLDYDYKRIPLEKAYNFNPVIKEIAPEKTKHMLGLSCQMWGEWIPNVADMYRQTFPRIAAYAEIGWTNVDNKNYLRFQDFLSQLKRRWDRKGIFYNNI